jgi:hypothetical protein
MEKKLFRVKVILYVMAENESEARVEATNAHFDIFECSAKKATKLDPGWDDAIPYNSEDSRTCAQIISSVQQIAHRPAHPYTQSRKWQPRVQIYGTTIQASPG